MYNSMNTRLMNTTTTLRTFRVFTQHHCSKRLASTQTSHAKPEQFLQTIVLSNGATYTVRTTSPVRSQIRLTKDTRNHPLWNPAMLKEGVTDESEQLTKFQKRFGDTDLADISWIESEETVSAAMKKVIASGGTKVTSSAKAKGKKK
ncbi:uncharacterized protein BX664DRAFT_323966 [Halteromyces radiatus]|uniref:uncharacterized protein n=1 Tax=Halteromyces radiatus TaxID=101107 RepID=UPI00221F5D01|nr:uncharacterized protein BX664DRAFT_323966 [Halteromyces radiatus]KAI8096422.1 hypothetical protein BX664DRAFT_323966 [Halteromyces radiatus]